MPVRPGTNVIALASVAALACSTVAFAAPATSEEINAANASRPGADVTTPSPSTAGTTSPAHVPVTQSKTVELLLQLQDQPETLREGAARGVKSPAIKADAAMAEPATPLANLKAAVLNSSALKPPEGQEATAPQRPVRESERLADAAAGRSLQSSAAEPRSGILNNPAIRFIRENRMLTAGLSALALAAVWATATFSLRRSR